MAPGEWIAVTFGSIGILKFVIDFANRKGERTEDHLDNEEKRVTQILSDLRSHESSDRTEFRWIKEALDRVERKVDNLQRQMAFVATRANNQFIEKETRDD